jgi:tetratricopeptide (TPR) repeat protein
MGSVIQVRGTSWWRAAVATGVVLVASAAPAAAQMELAVIVGHVHDEQGQPLEGVTVTLRDLERGREVTLKSDKSGRFYRRGLQAGAYNIVVEKSGYQSINDKLTLTAGTDRRFDFKLARATPEGAIEFTTAVAAFNRGDHAEAARGFEAAIAKAPDLPEIRVNLALAYLRLERIPDAVAQLEKAAAMAPNEPRVLFQLGGAYIDMKEFDKAIAAFEKGLSAPANGNDPVVYEAMISLASLYFAKGQIDEAKAEYEKALAANPQGAAAMLGLGKVAFNKGNVERALQLFRDVVARVPGTAQAAEADGFITALTKKTTDREIDREP